MARIGAEELQRLKREVDLVALVRASGTELEARGRDFVGRCPLHNDETPSLIVTPEKNLWHCMGACNAGGSVVDWVMKTQQVSFRHAVEVLRRSSKSETPATPIPQLQRDVDDDALLDQVVSFYQTALKESPEAQAYLAERGIAHPELIEKFRLGFANRTLGYLLPPKSRAAGEAMRGRLQKLGILRDSGHEHFNGCITMPILDESGRVVGMYGRKIGRNLLPQIGRHLYLKGPRQGVWNLEAVQASKDVILCEALIDAMTFWCAGFRNVTTSYGVNGFTSEHLQAFRKFGTERVLIAYDRDDAGDGAAVELAKQLQAENIQSFRLQFPKGMDANEYARKVTPAEKSLGVVVRGAVWMDGVNAPKETEEKAAAKENAEPIVTTETIVSEASPAPMETKSLDIPLAAAVETVSELQPPMTEEPRMQRRGDEVTLHFGDRRYRVRGFLKNTAFEVMKVNLMVARADEFHVDTLDMYQSKFRAMFIKVAAKELQLDEEVVKKDVGKVLCKLEELQEEQRRAAMSVTEKVVEMTAEEKAAAMQFLKDPKLVDNILSDFEVCGVVGEETNKLTGYLAAVSRKLPDPLAIMVQSSSAAGKSSLMDAVLAFMPDEEQQKYSAMTGQSLFYMGETNLQHKILALVEEEGAERASYALKLLQSEGELTIASTGKEASGRLVTNEYRVLGPVMIFLTTTAVDLDEELLNRCIMLTVDESREQTRAIHRAQRHQETVAGLWSGDERDELRKLHQNAQRLLQSVNVRNPFCHQLTFLDDKTRTRRDHKKYLVLIRSIALLHQYQRPVKVAVERGRRKEFIEVTLDDIALANKLAGQVLGRSLDELPPQTRRMLMLIDELVTQECKRLEVKREDYRFSRRMVRAFAGWTEFQVRTHVEKLVDMEYLLVHRGGRGQSFVYELLYDGQGQDGAPFLMGLADVNTLRSKYEANFEHRTANFEHSTSPQRAGSELGSGVTENVETAHGTGSVRDLAGQTIENAQGPRITEPASYVNGQTYSTRGSL